MILDPESWMNVRRFRALHAAGATYAEIAASTRTVELLRRFGLEDAVRATAVDVAPCAWIAADLRSGEGQQQPLGYPLGADAARVSPTGQLWAPQHLWEPLVLERLKALPNVRVRLNCQAESVSLLAEGALVTIVDGATQRSEQVSPSFVIAADGAHSLVHRALGISMEGPEDLTEVDRIEFHADVEAAVGHLPCGLNVVTDREAGGVLAPRSSDGRWGITREVVGPTPRFATMDATQLAGYVRRLLGVESIDVEIEGVRTFRFAAQLATTFRSGRVFLAGDAAHRVTPRGGTGLNMAIQDGFDLGWKLGFVLSGWATADLLDTYETERRRIAAHNVERSASNSGATQSAEEALPGTSMDGSRITGWRPTSPRPTYLASVARCSWDRRCGAVWFPGQDRSTFMCSTAASVRHSRSHPPAACSCGPTARRSNDGPNYRLPSTRGNDSLPPCARCHEPRCADLLEHYPHPSLAIIDDAGHALPHERPELLRALTTDWLVRVARQA